MHPYVYSRTSGGFTLIELLIVIGIIGILSSIFMFVFLSARNQGADSSIKANLLQARSRAEVFGANNNAYAGGTGQVAALAACPLTQATNSGGNFGLMGDTNFYSIVREAIRRSDSGYLCQYANTSTQWVLAVTLKTDRKKAWCVDNRGESKVLSSGVDFTAGTLQTALAGLRCN